MEIPLSRPDITELEIQAVTDVLKTPHLSLGPKLREFEEKLAHYVGTKYAVAVNSGTSALHLALLSCNIAPEDEVITTPFSFVASANCALFVNATPRFVDIALDDFNIDVDKMTDFIENQCYFDQQTGRLINKNTNKRVRAILPVHVFGHACKMEPIKKLADYYQLTLIEDACEALGTEYQNQKVGTSGEVGVFAFYPNKQITTGEGGAVVANSAEITRLCRSYRNQGRSDQAQWLEHDRLGYNYRLSDINCALGIAQLQRLDEILNKRETVARLYNEKLARFDEIYTPIFPTEGRKSWFVYVIRLSEKFSRNDRDEILKGLRKRGVACRNYFSPIHLQPFYQKMFGYKKNDFPITEHISDRTIALPFFNNLSEVQVDYVAQQMGEALARANHKYQIVLKELTSGCDLGDESNELF